MTERIFARGSSCVSIDYAIRARLNLPTNWYAPNSSNKPPGLSFVENDLKYREDYARTVARDLGELACVVVVHIDETNFPNIRGNIYNSIELPLDRRNRFFPLSRTVFKYEPVWEFEKIHRGIIAVAVSNLSDSDLLTFNTEVGFEHSHNIGFRYRTYKSYLKA